MFFYICENGEESAELWWMDANKADSTILLRAENIIKLALNIPTSHCIQTTLIQ